MGKKLRRESATVISPVNSLVTGFDERETRQSGHGAWGRGVAWTTDEEGLLERRGGARSSTGRAERCPSAVATRPSLVTLTEVVRVGWGQTPDRALGLQRSEEAGVFDSGGCWNG